MHLNMWIWIEVASFPLAIGYDADTLERSYVDAFPNSPLFLLGRQEKLKEFGEWEEEFPLLFNRFVFLRSSEKFMPWFTVLLSIFSVVKKMPPHFCESLLSDGWLCWKIRQLRTLSSYSHIPSSHSEWRLLSFLKKHNRFTVSSLRPCFLLVS